MKIFDQIMMCLRNLFRRKVRTALTVTGVVVGTCAIVVMISIGIGMKASSDAMLAQMGDLTIIEINNYNNGSGKQKVLDDAALAEIQKIPGVQIATPMYQPNDLSMQIFSGKADRYYMRSYNIVGVYPEALNLLGYEFLEGSGMNPGSAQIQVVFGQYAAYEFRDAKKKRGFDRINPYPDATGKIKDPFVDVMKDKMIIRTDKQKETAKQIDYKIISAGVLKEDWGKGYETSRGMFMDIKDLKRIEADYQKANGIKPSPDAEKKGYNQAKVKVVDVKQVGKVEQTIKDMGFETYSMETIRKPIEDSARQQQLVLGGLGAISLFVAAIGITNTMVMSIYERTREIGVMKVLGCFVGNIRTVFLMEAGLIGFIGGVVGVLLSFFLSFLMNFFGFSMGGSMGGMGMGMDAGGATAVSIIPPWLVVVGMVFATCIGLVAGFYPANRAVKISALEAIKHD